MTTLAVPFAYYTGLKRHIFGNARLVGNWDASGRRSAQWTSQNMTETIGEDGCPCFRATVELEASQLGSTFSWGVVVDGPGGRDLWAIPTEVKDRSSTERVRSFDLTRPMREQRYYLTSCRRLGANKLFRDDSRDPGIRFAAWAPNARRVDVILGAIWDERSPEARSRGPFPRERICGGYLDAAGQQALPDVGPFELVREGDGVWATHADDQGLRSFAALDHRPYMFRIVKSDAPDGAWSYRTDLYSRCQIGSGAFDPAGTPYVGPVQQLDGSVSCSVVVDPEMVTEEFSDPEWPERSFIRDEIFWQDEHRPDRPMPRRVEDLVIYELHVGALGFGRPGAGSLADAMQFLDHLEDLGVNAVELLPLSEFGGGGQNWGYATSHHFAIEYSDGGRDQYKWFVRECHRRGIAVLVDVVYNHFVHRAERAEWMYDTDDHARNAYYWYEGWPSDYPQFDQVRPLEGGQGGYVDNMSTAFAPRYHEELVRQLFISSAVALVEEFHVDGFRVDQTTSIHAYNVRHADGVPVGDANVFGAKLLREWTRTLRLVRPEVILIAEDHSTWPAVTETAGDGLGFDARWYADFYHHLIGDKADTGSQYSRLLHVAGMGYDGPLALDYFAAALSASGDRKVVYYESHDEAGNSPGTHRTLVVAAGSEHLDEEVRRSAEARVRLVAGLTLLSAGTPMLFYGEEVGAVRDFTYGNVLANREDLAALKASTGQRMFALHRDMVGLRKAHAALRSHNLRALYVNNAHRVLAFRRWDDDEQFLILVSFRNEPFGAGYRLSGIDLPEGGWKEVFNSDSRLYGGDGVGNVGATLHAAGGTFEAVIPANGLLVFQRS